MTKKTTVGAVENEDSTAASLAEEHREQSSSRATNSLELIHQFLKLLGKPHDAAWVRYIDPLKKKPSGADHHWFGSQQDLERLQKRQSQGFDAYLIIGNGTTATGTHKSTGKPSGAQADADITDIPVLFVEWDDKTLDWQVNAWKDLGLPEPSIQVHTGGKSIHCYWPLDEPMAPAEWRVLQQRLIDHCGADKNNKNPSRLMRLPGSIYHDKKTGEATGTAEILHSSNRRYSAAEIEACLPPVLAKAATKAAASSRFAAPSSQWEPRTEADLINALRQVPAFDHDQGRRDELLGLAFRLTVEIGAERGLQLMQEHSPAVNDLASYFNTEPTQINAGSIWPFLREHYNIDIRRTRKKRITDKPVDTTKPVKTKAKKPKNQKLLSHTRAMKCFNRCVEIQSVKERNSFRRTVRLLKAAKDLGLASYVNRVEIAAKVLETKQQIGDGGFKALTAVDRAAMKKPIIHWLLPGLIPANDLTILGGRPKVGKTRLAVAMAAAVLKGESLFDLPTPAKAAPVVLITDDQSDGDTASMLEALELWDHPNLIWSRNFRISETDLDALLKTIKANPGALVIIDSLRSISRSMQKGENDPEIGAVLYDLKQAVIDAGGTLLLIHHCNKAPDLVGVEALSGHNAIAGAANTVFTMHYLLGENNQPNKSIPERQLFREARSGDGLDLVITRDRSSFRSLGSMEAHKEKAQEQNQLSKLSGLQHQVLDVVAGEWLTRRQVCEELEIEWSDRGQNKEARQVKRALDRLAESGKIESVRAGLESTYRNPSRMGTKKEVSVVSTVSTSHTKGFSDTTFETVNGISGINQSCQGIDDAPASIDEKAANCDPIPLIPPIANETYQSETLLSQVDTSDATDTTTFNSNEKKNDRLAAEQRIRMHGHTYDLSSLTDAQVFSDLKSLDDATTRRLGAAKADLFTPDPTCRTPCIPLNPKRNSQLEWAWHWLDLD